MVPVSCWTRRSSNLHEAVSFRDDHVQKRILEAVLLYLVLLETPTGLGSSLNGETDQHVFVPRLV